MSAPTTEQLDKAMEPSDKPCCRDSKALLEECRMHVARIRELELRIKGLEKAIETRDIEEASRKRRASAAFESVCCIKYYDDYSL